MTLSTVRCQILGKAEIHTRGIRISPETEVQFGLALYFCAQAGRQVPRDDVARLFWPDNGIEAARHNLRQSLYRLRVLGVPVRSGAKSSQLETHMVEADYAPVVAEGAPASVFLRLTDVAVLPGYSPKFSRAYAQWVEDFRIDVGTRMRRGLVRAISEMRARGRYAEVERLCRFCLGLDPLNEEATLALAESVALAGGKVEAVGMIERYAGELARYPAELRLPASLLRERISDRLMRRHQAAIELPMIGREEDVERVISSYQRLKGSRAVSYVVTGASGVGKTRLATECCRIAELQGARVITIGTQPSSRTQALFAVSELVDSMLQLPGAIGCAPAALECLRGMSAPLNAREPRLSMETDGEARFAMVRWSILDVLDAILSEGPLVIHIDDAHQLDGQSQLILQDALRTHNGRPLLLLLTMRPPAPEDVERFERLMGESTVHELAPLSDDSCDRLVHRFCVSREEELDSHTRERIIQLSGGNPLFLLELLKHRSDLVTDDLPISVQAILEDRLGKLSPAALTVLRAAAVLGLSSNVERIHRLVERKTSDVLAALTELHNAGMLSSADSGTLCRHDTIRDAVLERTPTAARRLLHRRAAKVLGAEVRRDGGVAELWECLHHWRAAGTPSRGVPLATALGERLVRMGLLQEGISLLREAESRADHPSQILRALAGQARAARAQRTWPILESVVQRWRHVRKQSGLDLPRHSWFELMAHEAVFFNPQTLVALPPPLIDCMRCEQATDSHRLAASALVMIASHHSGDEPQAHLAYETVRRLRGKTRSARLDRLLVGAIYHTIFGDASQATGYLNELADLALTIRQPIARALYLRRACFGMFALGDWNKAYELSESAFATFDRLQLWSQSIASVEQLAVNSCWRGHFDQAAHWLNEIARLRTCGTDFYGSPVEYELRVVLAFESQRLDYLASLSIEKDDLALLSRNGRLRQRILSLRIAAELLTDTEMDENSVESLMNEHDRFSRLCFQDFSVSVLVGALCRMHQQSEARRLLNNYLTHNRRECTPLITSLRRCADALALEVPSRITPWDFASLPPTPTDQSLESA